MPELAWISIEDALPDLDAAPCLAVRLRDSLTGQIDVAVGSYRPWGHPHGDTWVISNTNIATGEGSFQVARIGKEVGRCVITHWLALPSAELPEDG